MRAWLSCSSTLVLLVFIELINSLQSSNSRLSIPSSTLISQTFKICSSELHSSDLIIMSYLRQQLNISSPALKMLLLSQAFTDGKNYVNICTIPSSSYSIKLVSLRLVDLTVQFYTMSCSIADKYDYVVILKFGSKVIYSCGLLMRIYYIFNRPNITSQNNCEISFDCKICNTLIQEGIYNNCNYLVTEQVSKAEQYIKQSTFLKFINPYLHHLNIRVIMRKHKHSKSVKIVTKKASDATIKPEIYYRKNESNVVLPLIDRKTSVNSVLKKISQSYSNKDNQITVNIVQNDKETEEKRRTIIEGIRQRSRLLKQLKQKIMQLNDNLFVKKILSQIRYSSLGKIAIHIWNHVQIFQNCDESLIRRVQMKYGVQLSQDFIKSMNFMNNICRFFFADYKKKLWNDKEKQINGHFIKINEDIKKVVRKIQQVESPQTKLQIISSIEGMKQECFAKKQRYIDWKQRAIQKLKQNAVHCQILRAQIFTQQFF